MASATQFGGMSLCADRYRAVGGHGGDYADMCSYFGDRSGGDTSEQGRALLEKRWLAPWASRRPDGINGATGPIGSQDCKFATTVEREAHQRPEVLRLMTHPGVGSRTGLAYVLVIGTPDRFPGGQQIGNYTGFCGLR